MLSKVRCQVEEQLSRCLTTTAGVVLLGLGLDYVGFLPSLTNASSEALLLLRDLAVDGALVMLATSTVQWILSLEAQRYMQKLEVAQVARIATRNK